MGAFTPFKRHANSFKYTPRHYDPAKEAREQRRVELYGERRDERERGEYQPGDYIRRSSEARSARRRETSKGSRNQMWITIGVVLIVLYMGSLLFSRIMYIMVDWGGSSNNSLVEDEFNPYAPILVVPNDYVEN